MGRSPCCEKEGMKKGPWTPEEDQILVSYVLQHGHSNWRALPKQAGLLRCGKSCRLRWVNYLKPDIKRGNFTIEEEEAIIKLHEIFGNRWSAIAAKLPGRTDNEIKNVWHTHLKKRLENSQSNLDKSKKKKKMNKSKSSKDEESNKNSENNYIHLEFPQQSTTTTTTTTSTNTTTTETSSFTEDSSMQTSYFPEIDESFWTEDLSIDDFEIVSLDEDLEMHGFEEGVNDGMDQFWYNVFIQAGGSQELPEF
ncbi:hypothetical protein V2J09_014241 [Rumex salicifolius]